MITESPKWLPKEYSLNIYQAERRKGGQHVPLTPLLMTMEILNEWGSVQMSASILTRSQATSRTKLLEILEIMFNEGDYTRL